MNRDSIPTFKLNDNDVWMNSLTFKTNTNTIMVRIFGFRWIDYLCNSSTVGLISGMQDFWFSTRIELAIMAESFTFAEATKKTKLRL